MLPYKRTALGLSELKMRHMRLSARARTLLLLIESEDLKHLSADARAKIINQDNIDALLAAQLIMPLTASTSNQPQHISAQTSNISKPANATSVKAITDPIYLSEQSSTTTQVTAANSSHIPHEIASSTEQQIDKEIANTIATAAKPSLIDAQIIDTNAQHELLNDLETLKQFMCQPLQQYAGLMAKRLIQDIVQCSTISQLRLQQRSWLTLLFETKMPKADLNQKLNQINQSIAVLCLSNAS